MRTKTAKSKAQAIREFVEKNPSAAMRSVAEKFDTSYPYTCMIIKEMYKKAAPAKMVPAEVEDEEGKFTAEIPVPVNALNVQVSGDHYKHMKDGLKDLEKIKHEVDLLIELEGLK
jgi:hypothetical protein